MHRTPQLNPDEILEDQAWDDVEEDEDDDDDDYEAAGDKELSLDDSCTCNGDKIFHAADELVRYFQLYPKRFPRTEDQIARFASFGGIAYGPWSMYVNTSSSVPYRPRQLGSIHLFGCVLKGHGCRVVMDDQLVPAIMGDKSAFLASVKSVSAQDEHDEETDDALAELRREEVQEKKDEERYDRRTFGVYEREAEQLEEDQEDEPVRQWQENAFPAHEVAALIEAGLDLQEVIYLSRLMPLSEVAMWAEEFGGQSMLAYKFLRAGVGELILSEEFENINFDDFRSEMAEAIRNAISLQFKKYENDLKVVEDELEREDEKSEELEYLEIDSDLDLDEELDDFLEDDYNQ